LVISKTFLSIGTCLSRQLVIINKYLLLIIIIAIISISCLLSVIVGGHYQYLIGGYYQGSLYLKEEFNQGYGKNQNKK